MKNLLKFWLLILMLISFDCFSQNYKVIYKLIYKTDSTLEETKTKNMLLDINNNVSIFYSYDFYKSDSLYQENLKLGKEVYQPMFDSNFSVVKNNYKPIVTKYYNFPPNNIIYKLEEAKTNFEWKILNETKKINNYLCQKAQLKYKGRSWTVWFTKEVPLNFGPYVFDGLPGAIMYMEDSKRNYIFELISMQKSSPSKVDFLKDWNIIKVSKKEFTKINLDRYNDPYKEMRKDETLIEGSSGELIKPNINQMTKGKQEFIKRHNNPIEILEAIKYP